MSFKHITDNKERFLSDIKYCLSKDGAVDLICKNCDFYGEDKEQLECAAFKLLRILLDKGVIEVSDIIKAAEG